MAGKKSRVWYVAVRDPDWLPNNGYAYETLEEAMRDGPRDIVKNEEGAVFYIARVTVEQPGEYRVVTKAEFIKEAKYQEKSPKESNE